MKIFLTHEIKEAYACAAAGGQALHVCDSRRFVTVSAPRVFRTSEQFAHLFDQNYQRMIDTAKRLGVRVLAPEHCGTHRQHIDLCAGPLRRAIAEANRLREREKKLRDEILLPMDLESAMK